MTDFSAFELKKTGDSDYPVHLKVLNMGPPKSGKTTFASTFPNVVMADVEAGLMSVAHKNVAYVSIDHSDKLENLKLMLRDDALRAKAAEKLGMERIESVAIDTLDALQQKLQKERLDSERRTSFQRDDWGWLLETMRGIVRSFVALPLHVVFTVHTKTTFDDENRLIYAPGLQGAIQDEIAGMVGFSLFSHRSTEVDPQTGDKYTQYTLTTEGDERNPHLGNRAAGRLPRVIEPNFDALYDAVMKNVKLAQRKQEEQLGEQIQTAVKEHVETQDEPVEAENGDSGEKPDVADVAPSSAKEELPAQTVSQPSAPKSDDDEAITQVAKQHLTKQYKEFGLDVPDSIDTWTIGNARLVAEWIVACKADRAAGKASEEETFEAVVDGLKRMDALDDVPDPQSRPQDVEKSAEEVIEENIPDIEKWVGDDADRALRIYELEGPDGRVTLRDKMRKLAGLADEPDDEVDEQPEEPTESENGQPSEELEEPEQAVEQTSSGAEPEEHVTQEEAEERIRSELGGTPVEGDQDEEQDGPSFDKSFEGQTCEECGNPIDDPDIAQLAQVRYKQTLCVDDYISKNRSKKSA